MTGAGRAPGPRSVFDAPCAHFSGLRRLQVSRIFGLRRRSSRRRARLGPRTSLRRIAGHPRAAAGAHRRRPKRCSATANKMEYSFAPRRGRGPGARPPSRGGAGTPCWASSAAWLTTDLGNAIPETRRRPWAARGRRLRGPTTRRPPKGYLRASGRGARAATPARALVQARHHGAARALSTRERADRGADCVPRGALDSTGPSTTPPAEITNLPSQLPLGRGGDRGRARAACAFPRPPERVPAKRNTRMAERLYALCPRRRGLSTGPRRRCLTSTCGIGTIWAHTRRATR